MSYRSGSESGLETSRTPGVVSLVTMYFVIIFFLSVLGSINFTGVTGGVPDTHLVTILFDPCSIPVAMALTPGRGVPRAQRTAVHILPVALKFYDFCGHNMSPARAMGDNTCMSGRSGRGVLTARLCCTLSESHRQAVFGPSLSRYSIRSVILRKVCNETCFETSV